MNADVDVDVFSPVSVLFLSLSLSAFFSTQVRDEVLGNTAEYTWRADMSVPELTVDAMPQVGTLGTAVFHFLAHLFTGTPFVSVPMCLLSHQSDQSSFLPSAWSVELDTGSGCDDVMNNSHPAAAVVKP